jgi:mannose-1-phosphate guanylyltransferase
MNYNQKLNIANKYLAGVGISWDDLGDINSLHDCKTKRDIIEYCNDRLADAGFPIDLF